MPLESHERVLRELTSRGYNADREAVTLIATADDPARVLEAAVERAPDDAFRLDVDHVRAVRDAEERARDDPTGADSNDPIGADSNDPAGAESNDPAGAALDRPTAGDSDGPPGAAGRRGEPIQPAARPDEPAAMEAEETEPVETDPTTVSDGVESQKTSQKAEGVAVETGRSSGAGTRSPPAPDIENDVTGRSTGTGEYDDFVAVFRDRYERLSKLLRGRVNHRPAAAIQDMPGGSEAEMIGLVNDIRSTASGHWLIELEDTTGTFPCLVMKDRDITPLVDELLLDECVAVQGTLADDAGIMFVDALHFPDVPRTFSPSTAGRHVQAALVSDVHVGSQEFAADAWDRFARWLHTEEAEAVEYLLIAGDMVEGVGVYPDQDEELDIVDIYEQYEAFAEHLKAVPGDLEIVMIPGNHDAVRLAEPQPGFDEELRDIMSAHDARVTGNPSSVTVEGVSILMYHGVSLDEVIAELPAETASYQEPHKAMFQLLKKRHVAPQFGGHTRLAPEERDYLVIEDIPDVFHAGHVHKLGWGKYHNVLGVNSGCWQEQTAFQRSVNIDPDYGYAPILDLDTLELTVRKFV